MKKILTLIFTFLLIFSVVGCKRNKTEEVTEEVTEEETPTEVETEEKSEGQEDGRQFDTTVLSNPDGKIFHVVGGYAMDWAPTDTNKMKAASLADVAKYSEEVAIYLEGIKDEGILTSIYMSGAYTLDVQPENASVTPALLSEAQLANFGLTLDDVAEDKRFPEGNLVQLNQGYAVKCIRAYFDEVDETYVNDRWVSDPKVAHTESLTPDTLWMPKWVENATAGEEHLGIWTDNPVCVNGPGLYVVIVAEYKRPSNPTSTSFGLGLFKVGNIGDQITEPDGETEKETEEIEPVELECPVVTIDEEGNATWDAIENAVGYAYSINGENDVETEDVEVKLSVGDSIVVKALGDGVNYLDSEYSEEVEYVKAKIDISGVKFEDEEFEYDGESHKIECENLPEGVIVTYLMNEQTEPGEYNAVAILYDEETLEELGKLGAWLTINEPTPEVIIPETGFHLVINGTTYVVLNQHGEVEYDGIKYTEFEALGVSFETGDLITLYNADAQESWAIQTPDQYSSGSWSGGSEGITCNQGGIFNVYVKMSYGNDNIYFGQ